MQFLFIVFPLVITLLIETGIYMLLKHRDLKLFLVVSVMNLILNPTMNIILIMFGKTAIAYWLILSVGEASTILIESLIVYLFMKYKYLKILLFALIANAASFIIGLALDWLYDYKITLIVVIVVFVLGYFITYFVVFSSFFENQ